jgi:VanZ family protein
MKNFRKILPWALVIAWMSIIFYLSDQPATSSNKLSTGITEWVITTVERIVPNFNFDLRVLNRIIRKNAHFIAYFILGVLALIGLKNNEVDSSRAIWIAFIISVLYSISDEFHQLFVPGRGGQIKDVFIDSAGAFVGIVLFSRLYKLKKGHN